MRTIAILSLAALAACAATGSPARASCIVIGDSVGVGLGAAMRGVCATSAKVGLSSSGVAARARGGGHWTVASVGSNDFPRGIDAARRAQSETRIRAALTAIAAKSGDRLIVVLPANGARTTVSAWAAANGVRTVSFTAGRDGIHPTDYARVAANLRDVMDR